MNLTVNSAPKLETLGCLKDDGFDDRRLVIGTTAIQVDMIFFFLPMNRLLIFVFSCRDFHIICICTWLDVLFDA